MKNLEFNETFYGTLNAQVRESGDAGDITPVIGPKFSQKKLPTTTKQRPIVGKINLTSVLGDFEADFEAIKNSRTTPKVGGKTPKNGQPIWLDLKN